MGQIKNIKLHIVTDIKLSLKMKRRYCELNLLESSSPATNIQNIKKLIKLGYNVVAINRKMNPPTNVNKNTPKLSDSEIHSFARSVEKLKRTIEELKQNKTETTTRSETNTTSGGLSTKTIDMDFVIPDDFELLSRLTVELDTPEQGRLLKSSPYKDMLDDVDIIAVTPNSEGVLKSMTEKKIDFDIVSLHLENELPFQVTRQTIKMIVDLKFAFEISYGHAIKSASLRKYIFQNGRLIVQRSKRSKGVILSCHGDHCLDFRSPRDVVNMAHLFDIADNVSHDVVSKNCWDVIAHAQLRKHTFMGAVVVEEIPQSDKIQEDEVPAKKQKISAGHH